MRHRVDVWRSSFLSSILSSYCRVRNKIMCVLSWWTVSALTQVLFWCLFPSLLRNSRKTHQNNLLVSAETVHHSSTYIILYVSFEILSYFKGSDHVWAVCKKHWNKLTLWILTLNLLVSMAIYAITLYPWFIKCINKLRQRKNGRNFPNHISKCIFLN